MSEFHVVFNGAPRTWKYRQSLGCVSWSASCFLVDRTWTKVSNSFRKIELNQWKRSCLRITAVPLSIRLNVDPRWLLFLDREREILLAEHYAKYSALTNRWKKMLRAGTYTFPKQSSLHDKFAQRTNTSGRPIVSQCAWATNQITYRWRGKESGAGRLHSGSKRRRREQSQREQQRWAGGWLVGRVAPAELPVTRSATATRIPPLASSGEKLWHDNFWGWVGGWLDFYFNFLECFGASVQKVLQVAQFLPNLESIFEMIISQNQLFRKNNAPRSCHFWPWLQLASVISATPKSWATQG